MDESPETTAPEQVTEQPEPTFSRSEVEKYIKEAQTYREQFESVQKQIKEREMIEAQNAQNWQKVAELKEKEAKEATEKLNNLQTALVERERLSKIRELAISNGLRKESIDDLSLIDFPEVKVETDVKGRLSVAGADKAVQRLKALRPHWFNNPAPQVNVNSPQVNGAGAQVTFDDLKKLEAEFKKTGNPTAYKEALLKFKAQNSR